MSKPNGWETPCLNCGKPVYEIPSRRKDGRGKYCSVECEKKDYGRRFSGSNNPSWKGENYSFVSETKRGGGKYKTRYSKMMRADGHVRFAAEHVLIAEKILGRRLKRGELVHHIDGDSLNNENSNLLICRDTFHSWLHMKMGDLYAKEHFKGVI